jgi:tRNA-2-methylthio-N6-dimethylallyladenosine synthase
LADDVPPEVKKARLHAVEEVEERISTELNLRLEGTDQEVLVEGKRENRWYGRTRSNKLVHFAGEASLGEVVEVHIDRATAWSLQGTTADDALPMLL